MYHQSYSYYNSYYRNYQHFPGAGKWIWLFPRFYGPEPKSSCSNHPCVSNRFVTTVNIINSINLLLIEIPSIAILKEIHFKFLLKSPIFYRLLCQYFLVGQHSSNRLLNLLQLRQSCRSWRAMCGGSCRTVFGKGGG